MKKTKDNLSVPVNYMFKVTFLETSIPFTIIYLTTGTNAKRIL